MPNQIQQWYLSIPLITRMYLTLSLITSLIVTFELLTPFHLYLNLDKVIKEYELWRIITSFLYFDKFGINLIFYQYFLYTYSRRLEEHCFPGRSGDFLFLIIFGMFCMLLLSPFLDLPFLSHSLMMMILYVWSRNNPHEQLRIYGLFVVSANWLSYILLGLSLVLKQNPKPEIVGILIGHIYFFGNYVVKKKYDVLVFPTPGIIKSLLNENEQEFNFEERIVEEEEEPEQEDQNQDQEQNKDQEQEQKQDKEQDKEQNQDQNQDQEQEQEIFVEEVQF